MDSRHVSATRDDLEWMLVNEEAEPKRLPFSLLADITNNFSDDNMIGQGGFARVYKGFIGSRTVAVKRLKPVQYLDEEGFNREIECLMKVKHKNIVRFLGYCYETKGQIMKAPDIPRLVIAEEVERLLCFQYLPNGSLDKYITDASSGLEWEQRYQIINGVCHGIYRLHEDRILHLDLKPENILLGDDMVPKISDFGLSRCLEPNQSKLETSIGGTWAYMAPELLQKNQKITKKCDLYSLGAIIMELLTGTRKDCTTDDVLDSWINRLGESQTNVQVLDQIKVCAQIGIQCSDPKSENRPPDTKHIIDMLEKVESTQEQFAGKLLLQVHPTILVFHQLQPGKLSPCIMQLTNDTDERMAFKLSTVSESADWPAHFTRRLPVYGVVPARSTYTLVLTVESLEQWNGIPENRSCDMILESCTISDTHDDDDKEALFSNSVKKAKKNVRKLTAFLLPRHRQSSIIHTPTTGLGSSRILYAEKPRTRLLSMDTHPTRPWIVTGHECGRVNIRDHHTQKLLYLFKVSRGPVWSVKFIARKQWFICSSAEGLVHVYSYETTSEMQKIKSFRAENNNHGGFKCMWLAVHPTQPYVLSLSLSKSRFRYEEGMRLWDWDKGWECTRTFKGMNFFDEVLKDLKLVRQIAFDPNKASNRCFATTSSSSSCSSTMTVWSLDSPQPEYHLPTDRICGRDVEFLEFFTCDDGRQYLIILISNMTLHIWDMQQREFIVTEEQSNSLSLESHIFCNSNLPILLTTPFRGIFHFRSSNKDLSIQGILDNSDGGRVRGITPLMRSKTRFAIGQENALTILHIDHGIYEEDQRESSDPHIFSDTRHGDTIDEVITQGSTELTYVHPLKVHFSFQEDKLIPCLLHLTNNIDKHVAFMLRSTTKDQPFQMMTPSGGIVPLGSTYTLNLKMPQEEKHFSLILQSCISGDRYIYTFRDHLECDQFFEDAKETSNVVQEVLEIALSHQGETMLSENEPTGQDVTQPLIKIRSLFHPAVENDILYSLYADPTESWIITGNGKGEIFIRDFDTQEMIYTKNTYCDVCSVKIIASKQWVVVGTCGGVIYVYEYETGMESIKRLKAKSRSKDSYGALVVHPNLPYVLSFYDQIQLWDWDKEWECIQTFKREHNYSIAQVTFSPKDTNIFASASSDCTIKLWSLSSRTSEYTLHGHCDRVNCLDFFTSDDAEQYLISGSQDGTAKIWGLKEKKCVHTMDVFMSPVIFVISLPDSPYITTCSEDGTVHLWSSASFRLERVLNIDRGGAVQSLCLMGSKRVVIKKMGTISIMDVDTVSKEHQELQVHPTLLEFELRPGKLSPCSLQLTNDTDKHMAFKLSSTSESEDCLSKHFTAELPLHGIVPAHSTCTLILTLFLEREDIPEKTSCDMILDSCTTSYLPKSLHGYSYDDKSKALFVRSFVEKAKNGVKLTAILSSEHRQSMDGAPAPTTRLGNRVYPQISWMEGLRTQLLSLDAHPTKPWIITGEECGRVSIWNHDTQKLLYSTEVSRDEAVCCVKFIARKQWFIASSAAGLLHVYGYEETEAAEIIMREIKRFQPHGPYGCVWLAVHPKQPYVMSWTYSDEMMLWDWNQGWECTRTFQSGHVRLLAFDQKETDRFTTAAWDKVTVWSLHSPGEPEYYLPSKDRDFDENVMSLEFFTRYGRQYLIIFTADTSAHIWDMQQRKFINVKHTNSLSPSVFSHHHPNPPMLLAPLYGSICRFWSPKNFRLKGILDNRAGGYVWGVARLMGSKTRFVIGQGDALTILDMNNGIHQEDEIQSIDNDTRQGDTGSENFILGTILDHPDWQGLDSSSKLRCHHNRPPRKKVCWDGKDTGRRFFGCYEPDETLQCPFIHWVDKEWPASAQWAMKKLWKEIEKNRKELAQENNNELAGASWPGVRGHRRASSL